MGTSGKVYESGVNMTTVAEQPPCLAWENLKIGASGFSSLGGPQLDLRAGGQDRGRRGAGAAREAGGCHDDDSLLAVLRAPAGSFSTEWRLGVNLGLGGNRKMDFRVAGLGLGLVWVDQR